MSRVAVAVALCAALAVAGCGGGSGGSGGAGTRAPSTAAPVHPGDSSQRAARQVATYRSAIAAVLTAYSVAQRRAFRSLHGAGDATAFAAVLGRLRRATVRAADRLQAQRPPAPAAAPQHRFVAAFRSLAHVLQSAVDARNRSDFGRLRRVGRRLSSGEFSRPIINAARQIDAALRTS